MGSYMSISEWMEFDNIKDKTSSHLNTLKCLKINPDAKLPIRATEFAAGYDLYSVDCGIVKARSQCVVDTGIAIEIPQLNSCTKRVYGHIYSRSGWSAKHMINAQAGVIDEDYCNSIQVILLNSSDVDFRFEKHTRVAQLVLEVHIVAEIEEVESLRYTERGMNGFGSTGYK